MRCRCVHLHAHRCRPADPLRHIRLPFDDIVKLPTVMFHRFTLVK